jgi:hypothetical protein
MGDAAAVGEFLARLVGEVDVEGGADAVVVHRDADQAFLGPKAEGMPDEAEDV